MLRGKDILIFGDDWGRHPSTMQHVARVFAKDNHIIWVGSLSNRAPKLRLADLKRLVHKFMLVFNERSYHNETRNVKEVYPFVLPYFDIPVVRSLNRILIMARLKRAFKEENFHNPIVFTGNPIMADIVPDLDPSSVHYFCLDDYDKFSDVFHSIREMEQLILERIDTSLCVSEFLRKTKMPRKGSSHFMPQGVDAQHFVYSPMSVPENIRSIRPPRVGFFGLIADWIDLNLIAKCAEHYPEVSFVLLGKVVTDVSAVVGRKNIYLLGEIPYEQLPQYASGFDVGIIPFILNDLTLACNPLKLLEYFSLGLPVVSTDLPEVRKFGNLVYLARTQSQFLRKLGISLKERDKSKQQRRRRVAQQHSWDLIASQVADIVNDVEKRKGRQE